MIDRKRRALAQRILALMVCATAVVPACGSDDDDPDTDCAIGAPSEGKDCDCRGNECICPSSGDCAIDCVDACDLQCAGSGNCDFECGADCAIACTGAGNCDIQAGAGSSVSCTGSGNCDITCDGDCTVQCPGQGTCTVVCAAGATCAVESCEDIESCPDGIQVCHGDCPG